jgi:hypothetical protein
LIDEIFKVRLVLRRKYKAIFNLGINMSLRAGDLLKLKKTQVKEAIKAGTDLKVIEEKTGKIRNIYLNDNATKAIRILLDYAERRSNNEYLI